MKLPKNSLPKLHLLAWRYLFGTDHNRATQGWTSFCFLSLFGFTIIEPIGPARIFFFLEKDSYVQWQLPILGMRFLWKLNQNWESPWPVVAKRHPPKLLYFVYVLNRLLKRAHRVEIGRAHFEKYYLMAANRYYRRGKYTCPEPRGRPGKYMAFPRLL